MRTDYRIRATAAEGLLRAVAVSTTESAREAQFTHRALPVAAAAMGRLLSAAAMLGSDMKDHQDRLVVDVHGDGPLGRIVAEVRAPGDLRARVRHPGVDLPLRSDGKLAVGQAVGLNGYFRVSRQNANGEWYQGQVQLQTGEIGEDFLHYLAQSEQVRSAVALGVLVGTEGLVIASGGVLVQALPDCPFELTEYVADKFNGLQQISRRLADGDTIETLLRDLISEPIRWYSPEPLAWHCWCDRSRIAETLKTLPNADLMDLIKDGGAEVTCHFCRSAYHFSGETLLTFRGDAP